METRWFLALYLLCLGALLGLRFGVAFARPEEQGAMSASSGEAARSEPVMAVPPKPDGIAEAPIPTAGSGTGSGALTRDRCQAYEADQRGWTSSSDMKQQVRLSFETKEEAIAYCERHGIAYQVFESTPGKRTRMSYSDNFAYTRRSPWTH
jgi:hypothetical protein